MSYKKIYLIGNNTEIDINTINKLDINDNDLVILFNKQIILKFDKIKNHKNKILFLRRGSGFWHGFEEYEKFKALYLKTFFVHEFKIYDSINFTNKIYDIQDKTLFDDSNKSPQSGWIVYNFIKEILNEKFLKTEIYLIRFTNTYKNGLWNGHTKEI